MKVTYTGVSPELLPKEKTKLEAKLAKLGKMIERRGEKEVHVILSKVRHLHKVELTVNAFDHAIAVAGSDGDLVTAMSDAIDKLEKQILKMLTKWRDTHRHGEKPQPEEEAAAASQPSTSRKAKAAAPAKAVTGSKLKVFRVNHQDGRKPMTLEEALLEMGASLDYLVYRDSKTDRICTLLRRTDGHLDLIES